MAKIKLLAFSLGFLLFQAFSFTISAQYDNIDIQLSATATDATCYNNGVITVSIAGADVDRLRLTDAEFRLLPLHEGVIVDWTKWAATDSNTVKTYNTAVSGVYQLEMRAFCYETGEWAVQEIAVTVTVGGNYRPMDFSAVMSRKSMNCRPTGEITMNFMRGTPPYNVTVTEAPSGYSGEQSYTASLSTIPIDNVPPGNYSITAVDACGYTDSKTLTVTSLANDVPSSLVELMTRDSDSNSNDCESISPSGFYNVTGFDEQYYWGKSAIYYEYAYSTDENVPNHWLPLPANKRPVFKVPGGYKGFCDSGNPRLVSYIRPIGCETTGIPKTHNLSYICPSKIQSQLFTLVPLSSSECGKVKLYFSILGSYAVCYPATYTITDKETGQLMIKGELSENKNNAVISDAATSLPYTRGNTYRITLTGADGQQYTRDWITPVEQRLYGSVPFANGYYCAGSVSVPVGSSYFQFNTSDVNENILPGTKIEYIAGPQDLGMGSVGAEYTIPDDYSSRVFYPTSNAVPYNSATTPRKVLTPGTYTFKITPPCGSNSYEITITKAPNYHVQPITYDQELTCNGLKVKPTGGLSLIDANNNTTPINDAYFRILSGPEDVAFSPNYVKQGEELLLPSPGTYTIGMMAPDYKDFNCTIGTIDIQYNRTLYIDHDATSAYHCEGKPAGYINIEAVNGVAPYTYSVTSAEGTGYIEPQSNTTGEFLEIGSAGGTYNITVRDGCNTSFFIPVTMLDLANARIVYAGNAGLGERRFCENSEVLINSVSLGKKTEYDWTYPDGGKSIEQRPRPIANYPESEGLYKVVVSPKSCALPITDSIRINILPAPQAPEAIDPIRVCVNTGSQNIAVLSGVSASLDCYLRWYGSETADSPIAAPVAYSTAVARTVEYFVSQVNSTGCESLKTKITVTVEACCDKLDAAVGINNAAVVCRGEPVATGLLNITDDLLDKFTYRWATTGDGVVIADATSPSAQITCLGYDPEIPVSVTVTDACGHATLLSASLTVAGIRNVSFDGLTDGAAYCRESGPVALTSAFEGGVFSGVGIISGSHYFSPALVPATESSTTIRYSVLDADGVCSSFSEQTVYIGQKDPDLQLQMEIDRQDIKCYEENALVGFVIKGGDGAYTYAIEGVGEFSTVDGETLLVPLAAGDYSVKAWQTNDRCAGEVSETFSIAKEQLDVTLTLRHVACPAATDGEIIVDVKGGTADYQYTLESSNIPEELSGYSSCTPSVLFRPSGFHVFDNLSMGNYTVTVTDANGCKWEQATGMVAEGIVFLSDVLHVSCFGRRDGEISIQAYQPSRMPGTVSVTGDNRETVMQEGGLPGFKHRWQRVDNPAFNCEPQTFPLEKFWAQSDASEIYQGVSGIKSLPVGDYICGVTTNNELCSFTSETIPVLNPNGRLEVISVKPDTGIDCMLEDQRAEIQLRGGWEDYRVFFLDKSEEDEYRKALDDILYGADRLGVIPDGDDENFYEEKPGEQYDDEANVPEISVSYDDKGKITTYKSEILKPGDYCMLVMDTLGCMTDIYDPMFHFSINPKITLKDNPANELLCARDSSGVIILSAEGGTTGFYTYSRVEPREDAALRDKIAELAKDVDTFTYGQLPAGVYSFVAQESGGSGCEGFGSFEITDSKEPLVLAKLGQKDILCYGDGATGELLVTALGATAKDGYGHFALNGNFRFKLNGGSVDDYAPEAAGQDSVRFNHIPAGEHRLVMLYDDSDNCEMEVEFEIKEPEILQVNEVKGSEICTDNRGRLTLNNVSGGTKPYKYSLYRDNDAAYQGDCILKAGMGLHEVFAKDSNNCLASGWGTVKESTAELPEPDFLVSTFGYSSDILAVIDITPNPQGNAARDSVRFYIDNELIYQEDPRIYTYGTYNESDESYNEDKESGLIPEQIGISGDVKSTIVSVEAMQEIQRLWNSLKNTLPENRKEWKTADIALEKRFNEMQLIDDALKEYKALYGEDAIQRMSFISLRNDSVTAELLQQKEDDDILLSFNITMKVYYNTGCDDETTKPVAFVNDHFYPYPDGHITQKQQDILKLTVIPNPVSRNESFDIQIEFANKVDFDVSIYNISGALVAEKSFKADKIGDNMTVTVSSMEFDRDVQLSSSSVVRVETVPAGDRAAAVILMKD